MKKFTIIFMGTPSFAVPSLKILLDHGYHIPAVVTAPDRPSGRGQKLNISEIKDFVIHYNEEKSKSDSNFTPIEILQPEKLKNPEFIEHLKSFQADLQIVVAFRMLPEIIWKMPVKGTFNLHASLLPQYRGAAPINWAIIHGEKISGITTFFLNEEIDAGEIIDQVEIPIGSEENFGEYHDQLKMEGSKLVLKTVIKIENGEKIQYSSKNHYSNLYLAPKLTKLTGLIDWNQEVDKIYNLIRGLSPFPTAYTYYKNQSIKIYKAEKIVLEHPQKPGILETDGKNYLRFYAKDGYISLQELQFENKKKMGVQELLRGFRIDPGLHDPKIT